MDFIRKVSKIADAILGVFVVIIACLLLFYSGYVIYDNAYKEKIAFSSRDLNQYKPRLTEDPKYSFRDIKEINPDTVGWLEIFDTFIDYPVMQGVDNYEYANKDVFGNASLTGAIYLDSANSSDFIDQYNIIYGHHMDNKAMFGNLDEFEDKEYFMSHRTGILQTPEGNYDLKIFACVRTNAYDEMVYHVNSLNSRSLSSALGYIKNKANVYINPTDEEINKLVVLSTCADETTDGRILLFANAIKRDNIEYAGGESRVEIDETGVKKYVASGHNLNTDRWALLNLVCVMMTFLTLLPIMYIKIKFNQMPYSREKLEEHIEDTASVTELLEILKAKFDLEDSLNKRTTDYIEEVIEDKNKIAKDLRSFLKKMRCGTILEILMCVFAVILFILTEHIYAPMTIVDNFTGWMILIFGLALLIDFICFRYRGKRPAEDFSNNKEET